MSISDYRADSTAGKIATACTGGCDPDHNADVRFLSTMDSRPALLLLGIFTSGGVRPMSAELADRLAARGWDVRLLSTRPGRLARVLPLAFGLLRHRRAFAVAHLDVFGVSAFKIGRE